MYTLPYVKIILLYVEKKEGDKFCEKVFYLSWRL